MRTKRQMQQERKLQKIKAKQKNIKREIKNEKSKRQYKKNSVFSFLNFFHKKPIPTTAQQTIPYQEMVSDGICVLL